MSTSKIPLELIEAFVDLSLNVLDPKRLDEGIEKPSRL